MKKIILILFLLINTFLFSSSVLAAGPGGPAGPGGLQPTIPFAVPGLNCGYAGISGKDSCCIAQNPEITIPTGFWEDLWALLPIQKIVDLFNKSWQEKKESMGIIYNICQTGVPDDTSSPNCKCGNAITPSPGYIGALNSFCQSQSKLAERNSCMQCANGGGVWSGVGCVKTDFKSFIEETVFGIGIGLAGGFSLLCIIYASFMMQSSGGNPEKLKKAQEMITSCIIGLMLIIFSVFILKLIGVNILRIPGFGS